MGKKIFREVLCVLGLPFDAVSLQDSISILEKAIVDHQLCFLSTPNLNFAIATQSDDDFYQSIIDSDLSVADGMPLIWVAKLLGIPISERVAGSTLFDELSNQQSRSKKNKVYFFGGQEGVAELAHQKFNETSSSMTSCGFYDPGFVSIDEMSRPDIIEHINNCQPDFIVVALGAKKGQAWIQKNKDKLNTSVISHLGAVINFVAGNVERAPVLWQRLGMEWLWRIRQEPSLWKRYFFDGLGFLRLLVFNVLPLAVYDRFLRRSASYQNAAKIDIVEEQNKLLLNLEGSFYHANLSEIKQQYAAIIEEKQGDVAIDCNDLDYIDSAFIATTLLFQRFLNEQGRTLVWSNVSQRIMKILRFSSVIRRFTLI